MAVKTVWKFPFCVTDRFSISIPAHSRVVHVEAQGGTPCMWAEVDPEKSPAQYEFRLFGTGHRIVPDEGRELEFLATFQDGPFVWHVYHNFPKR